MLAADAELLVVRDRPIGPSVIPDTRRRAPRRPRRTACSRAPTRPARVAVVGAGMAGLVAASELLRAGHDPILLEAQQRVGGRVLTLREPFAPGLWAEAGAMRIPRSHALTQALIERYGLATQAVHDGQRRGVLLLRRAARPSPRGRRRPARARASRSRRHERVPPGAALERRARAVRGARSQRARRRRVGRDRRRVRPVLRARVPRAARLVGRRDRDVRPPVQPGGADELVVPRAAARGARGLLHRPRLPRRRHRPCCRARSCPSSSSRIRFGAKVVAIDQSDDGVTVHCRNARRTGSR